MTVEQARRIQRERNAHGLRLIQILITEYGCSEFRAVSLVERLTREGGE